MSETRPRLNVLFVCTQNRLRSPTAEKLFCDDPRLDVRSAGVDKDATVPAGRELIEWADVVFVMERRHRNIIHTRYPDLYRSKRIICLYIPDEYEFMDPELVLLLKAAVEPHVPALVAAIGPDPE
jgi:predicted protein tyrosine phosphatase